MVEVIILIALVTLYTVGWTVGILYFVCLSQVRAALVSPLL